MSGRSRTRKAQRNRSTPLPEAPDPGSGTRRFAWWLVVALLIATAVVFDATAKDSFRLPKTLAGQSLLLLSVVALSLDWGGKVPWRRLASAPAAKAVVPFALVATATALASSHPHHVARGLVGLWIAVAGLWAWSVGFDRDALRRLLSWTIAPGALLAVIAILQFHDLWQPFRFERLATSSRLAVTSLAGNVGDLSAFLVLPALVAEVGLLRSGRARLLAGAGLVVSVYALVISQTLAALAALGLGSMVLWTLLLPRGRRWIATAAPVAAVALLLVAAPPLRQRAGEKLDQLLAGQINSAMTGRLDGWHAAFYMAREHPWTGVGIGAFRAEYARAKGALLEQGVRFDRAQPYAIFADAHNELLQSAAEAGLPGLVAFLWASWCFLARLRDGWREGASEAPRRVEAALAWSAGVAIVVLASSNFPFRSALVGFPWLVAAAWVMSEREVAA